MVIKNIKKFIISILAICVACFFAITAVAVVNKISSLTNSTQAATENGTAANPYLIDSDYEFYNFLNCGWHSYAKPDGYFKLTVDVELDYYSYEFNNKYSYSDYSTYTFNGTFDGDFHSIYVSAHPNYYVQHEGNAQWEYRCYGGLFVGLGSNAVVKNFSLGYYAFIESLTYSEYNYRDGGLDIGQQFGFVAGKAEAGATIYNCTFDASVGSVLPTDWPLSGKNESLNISDICEFGAVGKGAAIVENCYFKYLSLYIDDDMTFDNRYIYHFRIVAAGREAIAKNCVARFDCFYIHTGYRDDIEVLGSYLDLKSSKGVTEATKISGNLSDYSSEGGQGGTAWYYAADWSDDFIPYSDGSIDEYAEPGWPYLRDFMEWDKVNFKANPDEGTDFSPEYIYIPQGAQKKYSSSSKVIRIYDQTVEAVTGLGYTVTSWTCESTTSYIANVVRAICQIQFLEAKISNDVVFEYGLKIFPSNSNVFSVYQGAEMLISTDVQSDSLILEFKFKDTSNKQQTVYYDIPSYLTLTDRGFSGSQILNNVTVQPTLGKAVTSVMFMGNSNSSQTKKISWSDLSYGATLKFEFKNKGGEENATLTFTNSGNKLEYKANSGYTITGFQIGSVGLSYKTYSEDGSTKVIGSMIVNVFVKKLHSVTMLEAKRSDSKAFGDSIPATKTGDNTIMVIDGESIKCVANEQVVTYTYTNGTKTYTTTYTNKPFFRVDSNETETEDITISGTSSIYPVYYLTSCKTSVVLEGEGTIEVIKHESHINLTGDDKNKEFDLEFGTEIQITPKVNNGNADEYIYTFKSNNVVVLELKIKRASNLYYLSDTGLIDNSESLIISEENTQDERLDITPVISLKTYDVELK